MVASLRCFSRFRSLENSHVQLPSAPLPHEKGWEGSGLSPLAAFAASGSMPSSVGGFFG